MSAQASQLAAAAGVNTTSVAFTFVVRPSAASHPVKAHRPGPAQRDDGNRRVDSMVKVIRPGIAISATGLCIARPGATRPTVTRLTLASTPGDNGSWPELSQALREASSVR